MLAADEWGKVVILHFIVSYAGILPGTSTFTSGTVSSYSSSQDTTTSTINWNYGEVANLTLNQPKVQAYIKSAYSYTVSMYPGHFGPDLMTVLINVTGSQNVAGNYSSGYTITYSGMKMLNVTVEFIPPSTYFFPPEIIVASFPNQTDSITFTQQEQHVIQVALSNSTVQKLMVGSQYYVDYVTQFPIQNGTFGGDYFVSMYQENGIRIIGAFVNPSVTAVVSSYVDTRTTMMCFGSSVPDTCFTSPWNSTS